ncbi:MAG: hypothetical protein U0869_19740 [Chloroflexota bacterium]
MRFRGAGAPVMGGSFVVERGTVRLRAMLAGVMVAALAAVAGPVAPVALAATTTCVVTDAVSVTYPDLQSAVDAAPAGATLTVRGACPGATIGRTLTLVGIKVAGQRAVLDGAGTGRVLHVTGGTLTLQRLMVKRGLAVIPEDPAPVEAVPLIANAGAGVLVEAPGKLVLKDARVFASTAGRGGGIASTGKVTLIGNSSVDHNTAEQGGGIWMGPGAILQVTGVSRLHHNTATVDGGGAWIGAGGRALLSAGASVFGNAADGQGGGIHLSAARAVLDGSATVRENSAGSGGGIFGEADGTPSSVLLKGAAAVRANTTDTEAAAIFLEGNLVMDGTATVTGHDTSSLPDQGVIEFRADSATYGFTMRRGSTLTGNSAGDGGAAIYVIPYCGGGVDLVGVASRATDNAPTLLVTTAMGGC